MPKALELALIWEEEQQQYQLYTHGQAQQGFQQEDEAAFSRWVAQHSSFAFVGQAGRLSVIKEAREGGTGYWYVYRTQKRQTHKRYLGSSDKVTLTRLEQEARVLNTLLPPPLVPRLLHHRSRGQSYFLPSSLLPVCLWHWWCALACSRNCKASPLIG